MRKKTVKNISTKVIKKETRQSQVKDASDVYEKERLRIIFEYSPIAIWEEDFSALSKLKKSLENKKIKNVYKYLKEHPELVKTTFRELKVLDVNKAAIHLYGAKTKKELIENLGKTFNRDVINVMTKEFACLIEGQTTFETEFKSRTLLGQTYDVSLRVSVPEMYKDTFERVIVTFLDISLQKKLERHLRRMAQTDSLTGVLNHVAIKTRFKEEYIRAKRYRESLSCMMIDLDEFKQINDKFGHQKGDHVIKRAAALLKGHLREVDIIGRYGGDEFFIILPETTRECAKTVADRITNLFLQLSNKQKGPTQYITASVGVSSLNSPGANSPADCIKLADEALYKAKHSGRGCAVVV